MYTAHTHDEYRIVRVLNFLKRKNKLIRWKKCPPSLSGHSRYRITLLNGQLLHALIVYQSKEEIVVLCSRARFLKIALPYFFSLRAFVYMFLNESYQRCRGTINEQKIKALVASSKLIVPNASIFEITKTKKKDDINGVDFFITLHVPPQTFIRVPLQVKSSRKAQEKHKNFFPCIPSVVYTGDDVALEQSLTRILIAYTTDPKSVLHL